MRVYPSLSTATAIGIGLVTATPPSAQRHCWGQKLARDPIERMLMQEFSEGNVDQSRRQAKTRAIASGTTPSTATQ